MNLISWKDLWEMQDWFSYLFCSQLWNNTRFFRYHFWRKVARKIPKFSRGLRPRTPNFFLYRWIFSLPRVTRGPFPNLYRWIRCTAGCIYLYGENKSFLWNPTNSCLGMLEFLLWPPKVPSSDLDSPAFTKHTALSEAWRNSLSRGNLPSSISGMKQKKCATGALWGNLICLNFES